MSTNGHVCFVSVISSGCTPSVPADNGDLPNPSLYLDHTIRVPTESRDLRNLSPLLSCLWQARVSILPPVILASMVRKTVAHMEVLSKR